MGLRSFLLFVLITSAPVFGEIEKYFKPALDKGTYHQMKNIDFIYMINLDQRPEKFKNSVEQLHPFGIFPYRFSAVNGWELSLTTINEVGVKYEPWMEGNQLGTSYLLDDYGFPHHELIQTIGQTYFCHTMARGTIGIVLSHLSVLQDAYDSGYETIWVMEDDIVVCQNPHCISDLIDRLNTLVGNKGWDVLFTDLDTKNDDGVYVPCFSYAWRPNFTPKNEERFARKKQISPEFKQIGARYGAYSMIIRRSGMKKILDFIKHHHIYLPYDMDFFLPSNIRLFALNYDLVSTRPGALTDNRVPWYSLSIKP